MDFEGRQWQGWGFTLGVMNVLRCFGMFLVWVPVVHGEVASDFSRPEAVERIAFGSCLNPARGRPAIFKGILRHAPEVFVFLGDNIYGDTEDMGVLRRKYAELEAVEGFRELRERATVLATWDDHDYGVNDGGRTYPKRADSQQVFLDFFREPADSPRRGREGVYGSYVFGPPGRVCQLLLLDTRYFRDELPRRSGPPAMGTVGWYEPTGDRDKTLLGQTQWRWLEAQLQVPADLRILVSSIQVLAQEKGMENWGNVPHERKRLFRLLLQHRAEPVFAISGDVHFTELSKLMVDGYPFYDFTSSGMSNTNEGWAKARNSLRVGEAHWQQNAGLIEIDWEKRAVKLSAINPAGDRILEHQVEFAELTFPR